MSAVLIIDDEPDLCEALAIVLAPSGYEVVSAGSGDEGLALLAGRRFDLVVTDYMMPGMNGAQTLAAIKAVDPGLPVIVLTGYLSDETYAACRDRGAFAIMKKPFDVSELRVLLGKALASGG